MKYQLALESYPSLLLTSQLLVDQILHGADINLEVLKKTLHRRAISDSFLPPQRKCIEPTPQPVCEAQAPNLPEAEVSPQVDDLAAEIEAFGIPMDD